MFVDGTGQVFKEWTIPRVALADRSGYLDWTRQPRKPRSSIARKDSLGPRSLVETTIRVVAENIGYISEAHLDALPLTLLLRIWAFLEAESACFHAWRLFSKILGSKPEGKSLGLHHFHQSIKAPYGGLEGFAQPLTSQSVDFITNIVISGNCGFHTNELLCLADMKNLGVLDFTESAIRGPDSPHIQITDRLARGWSEKEDPFPTLKILRILCDQPITQNSLQWVSKFPSLVLFDVLGRKKSWKLSETLAQEHGWKIGHTSTYYSTFKFQSLDLFTTTEIIRRRDTENDDFDGSGLQPDPVTKQHRKIQEGSRQAAQSGNQGLDESPTLPPKPMVNMYFGRKPCCGFTRDCDHLPIKKVYAFFRETQEKMTETRNSQPNSQPKAKPITLRPEQRQSLRPKKRQRLDDVLQTFSG